MNTELHSPQVGRSLELYERTGPQVRIRSLGKLPDHLVLSELLDLNQQDHRLQAELLLYLGELDQRGLYHEHAVSSTFEYCVQRLGYSEDVAYKRVGVARLLRRYPSSTSCSSSSVFT